MNVDAVKGLYVPAGTDRNSENNLMIWGLIPLSIKVSTQDSGGGLLLFEHAEMGPGGPPRHVHHLQDEWFYVQKGRFIFEINGETFEASPGDSLFGPRGVVHAFACLGSEPGTLIVALTPAGTFETFLRSACREPSLPTPQEIAASFSAHDMTVVGPPIELPSDT